MTQMNESNDELLARLADIVVELASRQRQVDLATEAMAIRDNVTVGS